MHTWTGPLDVADAGTMVGRQLELARLRSIWQDAASGHTRLVLIAGEPGVGKTRLAAEIAAAADAGGARVLVGHCRADGTRPYEPFVEALGPALQDRPDGWVKDHVRHNGPDMARLFPDAIGRAIGPVPDSQFGPRARFLDALAAIVTGLGSQPVLLVLEDLHRATPSTVLALEHLVQRQPSAPLLVLGTYRDAAIGPNHPLIQLLDGPSASGVERLVLANLSPQAVTALLVDRAAVAGKAAAALARALWETTEGDPLLLTEVVRDLTAGGLNGGGIRSDAVAQVGNAHEISELVTRRLGRPGGRPREAVEVASVIGSSFSAEEVATLADEKEDDTRAALDKAVRASILVADTGARGQYRFAHDRFREVAYAFLPPNRQVRLHHQLAEHLASPERRDTVPAAQLVHHLAAATPVGRSEDAAREARRAGEGAAAVLAYEEAADFYGQALAFLGSAGEVGPRIDLLILLGEANHHSGESARARQSYLQAATLAHGAQDGPRLGRAVLGLGDVFGVWGADGQLIGLLEDASEKNAGDPSLHAKLLARLAQARAAFDTPDERKERSDRAWERAWDSKDPDTMGSVLRSRHEALSAPDDLEDRVEIDGELFAMATNAHDDELQMLALGWRLVDLLEQGHVVDADRDRTLHAELARRSRDRRHLRDAAMWAATWALLDGNVKRASTQMDKALTLGAEIADPAAPSLYWIQQLALISEWGTDTELTGLIDVWAGLARGRDDDPTWRASLTLLYARRGLVDEAMAELDELLAEECTDLPLDRTWLAAVTDIGEAVAILGDRRCPFLHKALLPYSRRFVVVGPGAVCRGSVGRVVGLLAAASGNWASAERHFQAALAAHERANLGPLVARTRADFGRALARKSGGPLHTGRVRTTLVQAAEEAERHGMARLAGSSRAALARLR